ncbi:MAG: hypothetical protein FD152_534 [Xanthobacteraceae bacterium]|nr:MAG: hypothetical protein FD152_534 [Xanthobacteraceae bacterium]
MPSDQMVEKMVMAGFGCMTANNRDVMERALAALTAAMGEEKPVGYVAPEALERFKREKRAFTPLFNMDGDVTPEMIPLFTHPSREDVVECVMTWRAMSEIPASVKDNQDVVLLLFKFPLRTGLNVGVGFWSEDDWYACESDSNGMSDFGNEAIGWSYVPATAIMAPDQAAPPFYGNSQDGLFRAPGAVHYLHGAVIVDGKIIGGTDASPPPSCGDTMTVKLERVTSDDGGNASTAVEWARENAEAILDEFEDAAAVDTGHYGLCGFIIAAARVALRDPVFAKEVGALMEPERVRPARGGTL